MFMNKFGCMLYYESEQIYIIYFNNENLFNKLTRKNDYWTRSLLGVI